MTDSVFYVYIVACNDGTLYTGYTNDIKKRLAEHNGEAMTKGARYTHSRRPVTLCYQEQCADKSAALKREYAIKQLSRPKKQELIDASSK